MKKVINGKMYNTETADRLCGADNRVHPTYVDITTSSAEYQCISLYKKQSGEYFLYLEGNNDFFSDRSLDEATEELCTRYFKLISEDEAKQFVAKYKDGDTYESIFGTVEE